MWVSVWFASVGVCFTCIFMPWYLACLFLRSYFISYCLCFTCILMLLCFIALCLYANLSYCFVLIICFCVLLLCAYSCFHVLLFAFLCSCVFCFVFKCLLFFKRREPTFMFVLCAIQNKLLLLLLSTCGFSSHEPYKCCPVCTSMCCRK